MGPVKLLANICRQLHLKKFLIGLVLVYVVCCFLLWKLDPQIKTLGNAFWFGFILITTIGFGDFTVTEPAARIVAAVLGLYGDFTITFLTGIMTSWIYERWQASKGKSIAQFMDNLEHLPDIDDVQLDSLNQHLDNTQN